MGGVDGFVAGREVGSVKFREKISREERNLSRIYGINWAPDGFGLVVVKGVLFLCPPLPLGSWVHRMEGSFSFSIFFARMIFLEKIPNRPLSPL